eukprot:scaffold1.g5399.t1
MQEAADPNKARGQAPRGVKRAAAAGAASSPAKDQQRKKPNKKDRRRVSFAPDPELTLVHHFDKDDELTSNSGGDGGGRPAFQALGAYQPGFSHMTVPENSPLHDPLGSPGQVSMELTLPVGGAQQEQQPGHGGGGRPEPDGPARAPQWRARVPGEVTAGLPSLGALAEADELEDALGDGAGTGWEGLEPTVNLTANITAAMPGLGALVEEDEEATAGMDLTEAGGQLLAHMPPQPAAVEGSPPAPAQPEPEPEEGGAEGAAAGRLSGGTDELPARDAVASQVNKWGFAPGREDTMDINLELHGRMIMGDTTFARTYGDQLTGDSHFEQGGADDTADSLLPHDAVPDASPQADVVPLPGAAQMDAAATAQPPPPRVPDWTRPAFLPPYMAAPAPSTHSDHPALAHSPEVTNSSMGTVDTRRVSVDARRTSLDPRLGMRRLSTATTALQDATGRLLADDDLDDGLGELSLALGDGGAAAAAPLSAQPQAQQGRRLSRRRSSGASLLGKDMTENLLAEEEDLLAAGTAAGEADVLSGLQKQIRIISQGSPAAAALQAAAAAQQLAEEQLAGAGEEEEEGLGTLAEAPPAKTPRTTASLGYADSHNPATMAILRSGGTTRLLRDTLHARGAQGGARAGSEGPAAPAHSGDAAPTGRTNGTTRLLADMTMASSIGAKQLLRTGGRGSGGAADLGDDGQGIADFSLDEFEPPPELQGGAQPPAAAQDGLLREEEELALAMEMEQQEAAAAAAAQQQQQQAAFLSPPPAAQHPSGGLGYPLDAPAPDGVIPGGPRLARTPVSTCTAPLPQRSVHGTPASLCRSQRSRSHQPTPSGGLRGAAATPGSAHGHVPGASYPMDVDATAEQIPGGPKLARTPVGRTPATATHPLYAPPGSAVAQHYPGSAAAQAHAPGSVLQQRYPGSAVAMHRGARGLTPLAPAAPPPMTFQARRAPAASGPGRRRGSTRVRPSASLPAAFRAPPSARPPLLTPLLRSPPCARLLLLPQDFAKLMEVQFLDNLRRGTSINYADLQPNPVPQSLADSYRLMCVTAPAVAELENGIRTLQQEVAARRVSAADAEAAVGQLNPPVFRDVQYADAEQLDELKALVGLLKKVCRQKAVALLKDVRVQMEESRGARLRRNLEALQQDLAVAEQNRRHLEGVAGAAAQFIRDTQRRLVDEAAARGAEVERRRTLAGARAELAELAAANAARRAALAQARERAAALAGAAGEAAREKQALQLRADALQVTLQQSQGQAQLACDSSPHAVLQKARGDREGARERWLWLAHRRAGVRWLAPLPILAHARAPHPMPRPPLPPQLEALEVLRTCVGWQLESAGEDPVAGELSLRLGDLFRMRLTISRGGVAGAVELLPAPEGGAGGGVGAAIPADRRALAGALAGCAAGEVAFQLSGCSAAKLGAAVQAAGARLGRIAGLVAELDGLRLALPQLAEVACSEGHVRLVLVNLDAEVKFAVDLTPGPDYPAGPLPHAARIWFDGAGQVSERAIGDAVARVPPGPGRVRGAAAALAALARAALPRPVVTADAAFHTSWANPLFG